MSIDDYANRARDYFSKNDFFEREINRTVDTFEPITQVFSTYESLIVQRPKPLSLEESIVFNY